MTSWPSVPPQLATGTRCASERNTLDFNVNACAVWNNKAYFFSDERYLRFDIPSDKVDQDPRLIREWWPGWPESWWSGGIQGALPLNQFIYFFRGGEYIRFDMNENRVSPGYPRPIAGFWPGWPASWSDGIDGCVRWAGNIAYFFKGRNYIRYDLGLDKVTGGPTEINTAWGNWPAGWATRCNGGGVWPDGRAYLFRDAEYVRYNIAADAVMGGYPMAVINHWVGWPGYTPPPFEIVEGGVYTFKSKQFGTYLTREAGHYVSNRTTAGEWERFTAVKNLEPPGAWKLKDYTGAYVQLDFTNLVMAFVPGIKPTPDSWRSYLDVTPWDGAHVLHFYSLDTNRNITDYYVSIQQSGVVEMRRYVDDWELLIVTRVG